MWGGMEWGLGLYMVGIGAQVGMGFCEMEVGLDRVSVIGIKYFPLFNFLSEIFNNFGCHLRKKTLRIKDIC